MRWIRWGDAIPAVIVLIASAVGFALWFTADSGTSVRVQTTNGVFSYSLADDGRYPLESNGISLTLVIEDGKAFVEDAACPDKVCEYTGAIGRASESIVCVPASAVITVEGNAEESAPDGVTR